MGVTIVLGRDGMGADATEEDFGAWTDYVMAHIDEACGFEVGVDQAGAHDVQSDGIIGGTDEQRQTVHERVQDLWERWCADGAPGVEPEGEKVIASYVVTSDGRYYVQVPDGSPWGFSLCDDEQSWAGGFGIATEWEAVPADRVPADVREQLDHLLNGGV